jgi:hypothetical protein
MNERLKELAEQAKFHIAKAFDGIGWVWCSDEYPIDEELERFAELIRADEREACAKFLESTDFSKAGEYTVFIANMLLENAKAIRARGKE